MRQTRFHASQLFFKKIFFDTWAYNINFIQFDYYRIGDLGELMDILAGFFPITMGVAPVLFPIILRTSGDTDQYL